MTTAQSTISKISTTNWPRIICAACGCARKPSGASRRRSANRFFGSGRRFAPVSKRPGELITTNYKGARRAISLVHPNMSESTSHTLNLAVQLVKAGEAVYSHRHTNAAMRFVIDGGANVYTITNGEKCVMERGDLVIQPSWGWHNHVNETERDAIWIDGLDSGLMRMLRTMFQEPHPAEDVRLYNSPADTTLRNPGLLAPPGQPIKSLVYKWTETRRALSGNARRQRQPVRRQMSGVSQSGHRRRHFPDVFLLDPNARRQPSRPPSIAIPRINFTTRWKAAASARWKARSSPGKRAIFSSCPTGLGTTTRILRPRPRCCSPPPTGRSMKRSACIASRAGRQRADAMNDVERAYNSEEFAAGANAANPGVTLPAQVGIAAPEFAAAALDGTTIRLSDFRGAQPCGHDDRRGDQPDVRLRGAGVQQAASGFRRPWLCVFLALHARISPGGKLPGA